MFLKVYLVLFTTLVSSEGQHTGGLVVKINNKEIETETSYTKRERDYVVYVKNMIPYNFFENEKMNVTCESADLSGKTYHMSWMTDSTTLSNICVYSWQLKARGSIYVNYTPTPNSSIKCILYAGSTGDNAKCIGHIKWKDVVIVKFGAAQKRPNTDKHLSENSTLSPSVIHFKENMDTEEHTNKKNNEDKMDLKKTTEVKSDVEITNAKKSGGKALEITGLKQDNILIATDDLISYKYTEGEELFLTCVLHTEGWSVVPKLNFEWLINGALTKSKLTNKTLNLKLDETKRNANITCQVKESGVYDGTEQHAEKIIKIVYIPPEPVTVLSDMAPVTDRSSDNHDTGGVKESEKLLIMYIIIAVISTILLIVLIILIVLSCKKNKVERSNTIVHCNTAIKTCEVIRTEDPYSNPADAYYAATSTVSTNYSIPYTVLYTTPIPKKLRIKNNTNIDKKIDYENLQENRVVPKNDKIPYENLKSVFDGKYVNLEPNLDSYNTGVSDYGSDIYCYSRVDK